MLITDKEKLAETSVAVKEASSTLSEDKELDAAIDMSLAVLPLETAEQNLMLKIIEAPTKEELQEQLDLFNINQSKQNAVRIVKLNNLLNKVEDQAIERFEKRPDQVSNRELLEYMSIVSNQIDRAQKSIDAVQNTPAITINNQKNEVNINMGPQLDRDSKEKVMDVITALLKQVQKDSPVIDANFTAVSNDDEIVDVDDTNNKLNKEEN